MIGWHGLSAAKVYIELHPAEEVLVLEAEGSIGGTCKLDHPSKAHLTFGTLIELVYVSPRGRGTHLSRSQDKQYGGRIRESRLSHGTFSSGTWYGRLRDATLQTAY